MSVYEDRICPECGITFTPTKKNQIYHSHYCRTKANRKRHKGDDEPLDATGLLDEIRKVDTETAADIEDIAKRAGLQIAEEILLVCWRAMNRSAIRHAKQILIEDGQISPKKRRAVKKV